VVAIRSEQLAALFGMLDGSNPGFLRPRSIPCGCSGRRGNRTEHAPDSGRRAAPGEPVVTFCLRQRARFTTAGLARMIERAAAGAGLELKAHPHMLRHACGYALANNGDETRAIRGIARSPARRSTRRWRRTGSRISGRRERAVRPRRRVGDGG
jgi:hypothetical protein